MKDFILENTFIKFILVGLVNTFVGMSVMFVCYNVLNCNYWFSSTMNYVTGSVISYYLNKNFTFRNKARNWRIVVKFIINIVICYLLAFGLAQKLALIILSGYALHFQENIAMFAGSAIFIILNYIGQKLWAFSNKGLFVRTAR